MLTIRPEQFELLKMSTAGLVQRAPTRVLAASGGPASATSAEKAKVLRLRPEQVKLLQPQDRAADSPLVAEGSAPTDACPSPAAVQQMPTTANGDVPHDHMPPDSSTANGQPVLRLRGDQWTLLSEPGGSDA